ncbi:MAG TPA: hypothetical protein VJ508_05865, partial [Saprospiraceae bacterium]|nr:hypothetical protein [Saprospiraceae bacterium]
ADSVRWVGGRRLDYWHQSARSAYLGAYQPPRSVGCGLSGPLYRNTPSSHEIAFYPLPATSPAASRPNPGTKHDSTGSPVATGHFGELDPNAGLSLTSRQSDEAN